MTKHTAIRAIFCAFGIGILILAFHYAAVFLMPVLQQDNWINYSYPESFFAVDFPSHPRVTNNNDKIQTYADLSLTYQALGADRTLYQAGYATYGQDVTDEASLEGSVNAVIATFKPNSFATTSVERSGYRGIAYYGTLQNKGYQVRGNTYVKGRKLYQLFVICEVDCKFQDVDRFFESFRMLK